MKFQLKILTFFIPFLLSFSYGNVSSMNVYQISLEMVKEYESKDVLKDTIPVFKILKQYRARFFDNRYQMSDSILSAIKDYPQFHKITDNFIHSTKILKTDSTVDNTGVYPRIYLGQMGLDSLYWYIREDLKTDGYSKTANQFLANLENVEFPDTLLAHHYAVSLFAASMGVCNDSVVSRFVKESDMKWSEENVREFLMQRSAAGITNKKMDSLVAYFKRFQGRNCQDGLWRRVQSKLDHLYSTTLKGLVDSSFTGRNSFDDSLTIHFGNKDCGCSQHEELNGEVFGIYPYWYAGDSTKWVDFEGITRLGFYGLHAANDGSLEMPSGTLAKDYLARENKAEFINEAHRHFVKLDWIVSKDDWEKLDSEESLQKFFDNLKNEVVTLMSPKVNTTFERFVNFFTFYTDELEYRGDGVTFFFKNYPKDKKATEMFNRFFVELQKELSKINEDALVNMMAYRLDLAENMTDENVGIYSYANFAKISTIPNSGKMTNREEFRNHVKNYFLVVIEEPVSRGKRLVLSDLDQQLNGENRRNVLHSIVPVLWFDNKQWNQLRDDAMYYNDTYYSLGIAPYATSVKSNDSCRAFGNLGMCMIQFFENDTGDNKRQGSLSSFVCRHRWVFRFATFFTFLVAVGVLIGYAVSYRISDYFNNHLAILLGVVVIPSAVMMSLLSRLDPSVSEYRGTFGLIPILILLASVVAIILLQVYSKNDLPKRNT